MYRFIQGIFERVRRRKGREISKHHFFQPNIIQYRLEDDRAFFKLRRRKDNDTDHGKPGVAEQTRDHQDHCQGMADRDCTAGCCSRIDTSREVSPQDTTAVQRIRGQKI